MTDRHAHCAAARLFRDEHLVGSHPYQVTTPDGRQYDLCGGACLVFFATLAALPADVKLCQIETKNGAAA